MAPLEELVSTPPTARFEPYETLSIDSRSIVPLLVTLPAAVESCAVPTVPLPCTQTVAAVERLPSSVVFASARMVCAPTPDPTLREALLAYTAPSSEPPLKFIVPFIHVKRPLLALIEPPS